jgi:uracil-DNA glycosylase family 4
MSYDPRQHGALCGDCPLNGRTVVPPQFHRGPKAIVGEAPGWTEARDGKPFIGASGQLLNDGLSHVGLRRQQLHVTNAVLCHPPDRGRGPERGPDTTLVKKAVKFCKPRLLKELKNARVKEVFAVGAVALKALVGGNQRILKARGFVWKVTLPLKLTIYASVHPAFVLRTPPWEPVFATDLKRFASSTPIEPAGEVRYLTDGNGDLRFLKELGDPVGLDIETTREPPTSASLLCVGVSDGTKTAVVPFASGASPTRSVYRDGGTAAAKALTAALATRTAILHNGLGFDLIVLPRYGIQTPKFEDTLIAHHAFAGHMPQRLDHVVSMFLTVEPWKRISKDDEKGGWDPNRMKDEDLWKYNARDAQLTVLTWLHDEFQEALNEMRNVYELDKKLAVVAKAMQEHGILLDKRRRRVVDEELKRRAAAYLGLLRKLTHREKLNPNRLADVRKAIFKILKAPVLFRTVTTNAPSTSAETLQLISNMTTKAGKFCKLLLGWREASKLLGTYVRGKKIVVEKDGAVHSSWRSWGTVTGRFASRNPNLANLPHEDKLAQLIKSLYVARCGCAIVYFDFRQLEPRIAAYASNDQNMITAVESTDYHAVNAELLFGKLPGVKGEPQYDKLRYAGKRAGLAINYLADAPTLQTALVEEGLNVDIRMVEAALNRLHKHYVTYFKWQEQGLAFVQQHGFMLTHEGRKRWFGRTPIPTEPANYRIQGGAADVVNPKLIQLHEALATEKDCHILFFVYDAVGVEVPVRKVKRVSKLIRQIAETPVSLNGHMVTFPVDMKTGRRWSDV